MALSTLERRCGGTKGVYPRKMHALELIRPFTTEELERALKDLDSSSAPGPDGLPIGFIKNSGQR